MARRPRKTSRWPIVLAEVFLLHSLTSVAYAAATPYAASQPDNSPLAGDPADAMSSLGGTDLYLQVSLNGNDAGLMHFGLRDNELWATPATLRRLGFALPTDAKDPVRLGSLPGVSVAYHAQEQTVGISAPLSMLKLTSTQLNPPPTAVQNATASPGLLLNYDLYGTQGQHDSSSLSAFTELRAFNSMGVLSSSFLSQVEGAGGDDWHGNSVRLDTSWSTSFPSDMLTLTVGDTLTSALSWSRPTRIGGIQFGTNFALQPYRITTPLPSFLGSATLPSNVDLYVDGMRQYSGKVPAGPFQLNTIPNISGAGNAQVVLTDALGRVTTLDFSLYDTPQLLQQGLSDWSVELGAVRKNYGIDSFDYGHDPAASGTWRYGVTNSFTAEAHGEAISGLSDGGIGGDWLLGENGGVLAASAAHSEGSGRAGSQFGLAYSWRDDHFNFSVNGLRTSGDYRDVASLYSSAPPTISASALVGYSTAHFGNFGVGYVHLRYPQEDASRYGSAYWYKSLGRRLSLNINLNQNLDRSSDRDVFVGLTLALDNNITVGGDIQRNGDRSIYSATASQTAPTQGGFGWHTTVQQGDGQSGGVAELDYLGSAGLVDAGMYGIGSTRYAYAGATGALVLMDGHTFAARHVDDAFAVVSTDGMPNVPVRLENNPIGTTNSDGLLLITPLNSYQNNQISIDPMQLPVDVRIDRVKTIATPSDRAGMLVTFGITPIRAASVLLVDSQGKPLPVGSTVRANGQSGEPAMVGFDGTVYLDTLKASNVLDVQLPSGASCHVHFDDNDAAKHTIPQIGPLRCSAGAAP